MTTDVFATATTQLDAPWSDPGETMAGLPVSSLRPTPPHPQRVGPTTRSRSSRSSSPGSTNALRTSPGVSRTLPKMLWCPSRSPSASRPASASRSLPSQVQRDAASSRPSCPRRCSPRSPSTFVYPVIKGSARTSAASLCASPADLTGVYRGSLTPPDDNRSD